MKEWSLRTQEEANLFNPAFCCTLLALSASTYGAIKPEGMPFSLAFLVLPIVLHKRTRESLPYNTRTTLSSWLQTNQEARLHFAERVIALKPHTKEAITFATSHNWLDLESDGTLISLQSESSMQRKASSLKGEANECISKARLVGKWFALAGNTSTVMTLWGVRP